MKKDELIENLKKYVDSKNVKIIKLSDIYKYLQMPYEPKYDMLLKEVLEEMVSGEILTPLKTSKKMLSGCYEKYKIKSYFKNEDCNKNIKEEIINTLVKDIDINYLLKEPIVYMENKDVILPINNFLKNPDTNILTVNERSYLLFKDEKKLKNSETILKKLGISFKDLYSYDTYEPFIYYENLNFKGKEKKIFIIENKDTFWTMKNVLLEKSDIYMVIYGEGKKILNSFLYVENLKVSKNDLFIYFGDIDYEGISIYISLKEKFSDYQIKLYKTGYETILDLEKEPQNIKTKQVINLSKIEKFINEFDEKYRDKLKYIFDNKKYIPQEVFNFKVAKTKV